MPAALPADHDDDDGGAARRRCRWRSARGTGSELRRPLGITIVGGLLLSPGADALHDAGHLSRLRPARPTRRRARGPASRSPPRPAERRSTERHEHLRALHPPAGRHHAAERRRSLLAGALALSACCRWRRCRRSSSRRSRCQASLPGASPETMARRWRRRSSGSSARIAGVTEMTSTSCLGSTHDHAAVRSRPQHRRRRARRAGGDQRRARPAAGEPAEQPDLPQGQPGRRADHDPVRSPRTRCRPGRLYDAADSMLAQKLSQVEGVGQVIVGGGALPAVRVRGEPDGAHPARHRPRRRARRARPPPTPTAQGRARRRHRGVDDQRQRSALRGRPSTSRVIVAYRNGAPVRLGDVADGRDSVEDLRAAGLANGKRAVLIIVFRQPGRQHHRDGRPRPRAAAAAPGVDPAAPSTSTSSSTAPRPSAPRCTTSSSRCVDLDRRWSMLRGLRVPAQRARDADPERGRAALAARHVRRHVPPRLQPRQPVADGADDRDRLRRRRRDRRDREHHALPRARAMSPAGGRPARRARDRLHGPLDQRVAGRRVHPDPAHGRHRRPAVPRVRGDAVARHRRLAAWSRSPPRR